MQSAAQRLLKSRFFSMQTSELMRKELPQAHLSLKHDCKPASVAGNATMPTAWTSSVLITRFLFLTAFSLRTSEIAVLAVEVETYSPLSQNNRDATGKKTILSIFKTTRAVISIFLWQPETQPGLFSLPRQPDINHIFWFCLNSSSLITFWLIFLINYT